MERSGKRGGRPVVGGFGTGERWVGRAVTGVVGEKWGIGVRGYFGGNGGQDC